MWYSNPMEAYSLGYFCYEKITPFAAAILERKSQFQQQKSKRRNNTPMPLNSCTPQRMKTLRDAVYVWRTFHWRVQRTEGGTLILSHCLDLFVQGKCVDGFKDNCLSCPELKALVVRQAFAHIGGNIDQKSIGCQIQQGSDPALGSDLNEQLVQDLVRTC